MTMRHKAGNIEPVSIASMLPRGYHLQDMDCDAVGMLVPPAGGIVRYLMIQCHNQVNIRYTLTSAAAPSNPSATFGFILTAGNDPIIIPIEAGIQFRYIGVAVGAILEYQWFE